MKQQFLDTAAIEATYEESRRRWLHYLHRLLGDGTGAEDALHESWLVALESQHNSAIAPEEVGIGALRQAHRLRRRARREAPGEIERGSSPARAGVSYYQVAGERRSAPELLDVVRDAMGDLRADDRELLTYYYELRRPARMLARERGLSRAAVLSRLKRCRARLRNAVLDRLQPAPPEGASKLSQKPAPENSRSRCRDSGGGGRQGVNP